MEHPWIEFWVRTPGQCSLPLHHVPLFFWGKWAALLPYTYGWPSILYPSSAEFIFNYWWKLMNGCRSMSPFFSPLQDLGYSSNWIGSSFFIMEHDAPLYIFPLEKPWEVYELGDLAQRGVCFLLPRGMCCGEIAWWWISAWGELC